MNFGFMHIDAGAAIAIVFWLFVAAAAITPMIVGYKIRRAAMDTIRAAIDRGQELSPEVIKQLSNMSERLSNTRDLDNKVLAVHMQMGGIITMAVGVGIAVVATVFLFAVPIAAPYIFAGAGLVLCVGGGVFFASKVIQQHQQNEKVSNPTA